MSPTNPLHEIEYFRSCFVLIPEKETSLCTILSTSEKKEKKPRIFCTCCKGSYATCSHAQKLQSLHDQLLNLHSSQLPHEDFLQSPIKQLFNPLLKRHPKSASSVKIAFRDDSIIFGEKNTPVHIECSRSNETIRLLERAGLSIDGFTKVNRAAILRKTTDFVYTQQEKMLVSSGNGTVRITEEKSIWYALAYHLFRELGKAAPDIQVSIIKSFEVIISTDEQKKIKITVPGDVVPEMVRTLKQMGFSAFPFTIQNETSTLKFKVDLQAKEVAILPMASISGSKDSFEKISSTHIFGSMAYLPGNNTLVSFDSTSLGLLAQGWGKEVKVKKEQFSEFLEKNASVFSSVQDNLFVTSTHQYDLFAAHGSSDNQSSFDRLINMPCFTSFDNIDMEVLSIEGQWSTLCLVYKNGRASVTLEKLLETRREGKRYCITAEGFIDCESEGIVGALPFQELKRQSENVYLFPRSAFMQFMVRGKEINLNLSGGSELVNQLRSMGSYSQLSHQVKTLKSFTGKLRPYQQNGLDWLLFIYDNGLGGLLCDDMGLGKTHQILSFIATLKEHRGNRRPVLVICPVSVMGHWKKLCSTFAPGINCSFYYGSDRDSSLLDDTTTDLFITSYGVMRSDCEELSQRHFEVAIFDEAQQLKNSTTAVSQAAEKLFCNMKMGLSGTPVENSLSDLKRLFDIVLPGYLGSDGTFRDRFIDPIENRNDEKTRTILKLSIAPFILRRLKTTVLSELPPKIEDNRSCSLSEEQTVLYTDTMFQKGRNLVEQVSEKDKPIPYMHVFALLKRLKEICNHPALALKCPSDYREHSSGKWDLFTEIMEEALGSGQKVVVFSQYLDMIEIIRHYLEEIKIGHVILTGSSRNREKLISRFNDDPQCRVFIGSLKAGGVGIDLTSASVVIHYDRWWNASTEDQATDRVHRMGQSRGVQVIKLITEDTLEEKIEKIISRKKELASLVIGEDSPEIVKSFTRDEILELLEWNRERQAEIA